MLYLLDNLILFLRTTVLVFFHFEKRCNFRNIGALTRNLSKRGLRRWSGVSAVVVAATGFLRCLRFCLHERVSRAALPNLSSNPHIIWSKLNPSRSFRVPMTCIFHGTCVTYGSVHTRTYTRLRWRRWCTTGSTSKFMSFPGFCAHARRNDLFSPNTKQKRLLDKTARLKFFVCVAAAY